MNNKKGFVSMTMLYTFLVLFLFIMLSILNAYTQTTKYKDALTEKMKSELQLSSFRNKSILATILEDNNDGFSSDIKSLNVSGDGIDFLSMAYPSNGKGLYYISGGAITESNKPIYFYRGDVKNNYIIVGNSCYRIIRSTGDGGIRAIYYGQKTNGICSSAVYGEIGDIESSISIPEPDNFKTKYNDLNNRRSMVGYKIPDSSDVNDKIDSALKSKIDSIYQTYISDYSGSLADDYFCNNRSTIESESEIIFSSNLAYVEDDYVPSLICSQDDDKFSFANSKLTFNNNHTTGTITLEEAVLAGLVYNNLETPSSFASNRSYLMNGYTYWTMTPASYSSSEGAKVFAINSFGDIIASSVTDELYAFPVITLRNDLTISKGTGTASDPYIIKK